MGDGVAYASNELKAKIVLDMCTLTGAQGVTTGELHASILTNREEWEDKLVKAGMSSGDLCYPILYAPELLISRDVNIVLFRPFMSQYVFSESVSLKRLENSPFI